MTQPHTGGTRVVWETIASAALRDNPLDDPATRRLPIILPPGYDDQPQRRYPVLYALTGYTGRGTMMLNDKAWGENLQERLDRLYAGGMPHAIVALPDCFTRLGGSQYLDSSATGQYETYLAREIVAFVDERYRTLASPAGRGVFGKSSGGYGAMIMGLRHADTFGAIACHSGDAAFDLCYLPDFPAAANALNAAGGVESWWNAFEARLKKPRSDTMVLMTLAMAACYSPDPSQPLGLALPFDPYTCALREDVWARWLALDPVRMVAGHAEALRSLRLLFLDCGTRDEFNLHYGARQIVAQLAAHQIPHEYQEFDDGHSDIDYRYDISLPKLLAALDTE